jgi:PAS domain S-box-containing protein
LDLIHPDDQESAMDNINQAIEQHDFLENEYRIIRADGKELWISALGSTVYDENDKPQRMSGICLDISDRKKISEELLKSQQKYRDVLDNMMEGCQIIDPDWHYIYVNDAAAKHGRISKEELLGHKMTDVYPGIEDTKMFATLKQCMDKRNPQKMVNEFFYPDGRRGWFELSIQPVPEGIFVLSMDITDRKMAEDSLKNSEKFLDTIIERSAHSLWISDENGTLIRQNQACRNLFHVSDQEVLGKYNIFNDNIIKEQGQMSRVKQVFEEGKTVNFSIIYDTSHIKQLELGDSVSLILDVTIAPVLDEKGSIINAIIQHVDITKREKAEKALIKTKNEKSKILEILNEAQKIAKIGSWDWDMETNKVWWSDETYQIFGVDMDYEPSFESNKKFIHPDDLENYQKNVEHSFKTGAALDLDLRIITKNGEVKNCYTPGKVIFHESGEPKRFIGNIMDITERRKADDEVKKSLIEKENLLKEIHHRVKNNMQIISSLLSLQTHYVDDDVVKVLEGSQKRVKSMALVHEKLYHSQSLSKIDMADYIQSLASDLFFSYLVKEGQIKLITEIDKIEFNIETAIPCGLIINELVSNSLKHAFPNERKGNINISLKPKTDQYELIIMDDGIGLSKDFELKNIDSLGLQLVNSLIHQLDGEMEIDHNQGTKFIITFKESDYKKRFEER